MTAVTNDRPTVVSPAAPSHSEACRRAPTGDASGPSLAFDVNSYALRPALTDRPPSSEACRPAPPRDGGNAPSSCKDYITAGRPEAAIERPRRATTLLREGLFGGVQGALFFATMPVTIPMTAAVLAPPLIFGSVAIMPGTLLLIIGVPVGVAVGSMVWPVAVPVGALVGSVAQMRNYLITGVPYGLGGL